MAIKFVCVWGNGIKITKAEDYAASVLVKRPWGYEVRVDYLDDATGKTYNEVLTFAQQPTATQVRDQVLAVRATVDTRVNPPAPPTNIITCQDGTAVTVLASDISSNVDLRITPTAAQASAWTLIRPVLAEYMGRIYQVYKRLPAEKQAEIRAHCSIFNQVLNMVGE